MKDEDVWKVKPQLLLLCNGVNLLKLYIGVEEKYNILLRPKIPEK